MMYTGTTDDGRDIRVVRGVYDLSKKKAPHFS